MRMLSNTQKTLTAVLFVGGLSRRMGADKATLRFAGEALWARQLQLLRELNADVVSVSARLRPEWCPNEIEVIADEPPSRGPLSGLSAALRKAQTTHLLALAIDLPRMNPATLRRLWSQAAPGCGVIPSRGNMLEPLCAIYPAQVAADAADTIAHREDVSMQSFVRSLCRRNRMRVHAVNESDRQFFQNVNTPLDFEACLSSLP
jgi:molybdopterin-guanine dinucleotide biosynthesis protein A